MLHHAPKCDTLRLDGQTHKIKRAPSKDGNIRVGWSANGAEREPSCEFVVGALNQL